MGKNNLSNGEIIKIRNCQIKNPGKIIFIDETALCKYKYLVAKLNEKIAHWYSREEIEIINDENIKALVNAWYIRNKEIISKYNVNRMKVKNFQ